MFSRSCKISVKQYLVKLCGCSFTRAFATKRSDIIYGNAFCAIVELQMWWKIHPESILISKDAYLKLFFRDTYCFIHFWCCFCLTVMNKFLLLCRGTRGWKKKVFCCWCCSSKAEKHKKMYPISREKRIWGALLEDIFLLLLHLRSKGAKIKLSTLAGEGMNFLFIFSKFVHCTICKNWVSSWLRMTLLADDVTLPARH